MADSKAATSTPAKGANANANANATHQRVLATELGKPLTVITEPIPKAKPGSAVVRTIAVDVPGAAKLLLSGAVPYKPNVPMTPGGSCVGVIESVADDVVGLSAGQTVVMNYYLNQRGIVLLVGGFSLDKSAEGVKQTELWKNGTWAQYAVLPAVCLVPVPDAIVKAVPAPALLRTVALSIAHGALITRGRFEAGQSVLVGGATGVHGIATVLIALAAGAEKVYVTGRSADNLSKLTALSSRVKSILIPEEKGAEAALSKLGVDVYVDFLPYLPSSVLTMAGIGALRRGGTAVIAGGVQASLTFGYIQILMNELTITASVMYPEGTMEKVLKLLGNGSIDTKVYNFKESVGIDTLIDTMETAAKALGTGGGFTTYTVFPNGKQ